MKIVEEIKDAARKTANTVVDTAEKVINKPKSPKELAIRFIEHVKHQEYEKIAYMIDEEAKKYIAKIGLEDITIISAQLERFKESMLETAKSAEEKNYEEIANKLKQFEELIPKELEEKADIFKLMKDFLSKIRKVIKEYAKDQKESKDSTQQEPDFSKLQEVCEEYFSKLIK